MTTNNNTIIEIVLSLERNIPFIMPHIPGIIAKLKRYLFGSVPTPGPAKPDMYSICSKCEVMKLFIDVSQKSLNSYLKKPKDLTYEHDKQDINTLKKRYLS